MSSKEWNKVVIKVQHIRNVGFNGGSIDAYIVLSDGDYVATVRYKALAEVLLEKIQASLVGKEVIIIWS